VKIIGCDLHARQQTLAMLDTTTGEIEKKTLQYEGNNVGQFYGGLARAGRVGIEASGSMQWFLNLMDELGMECPVGHPANVRAAEPRKQNHDRRDADLILKLLVENRFPSIWLPSKELLDLRALLLHRHQWVRMRTGVQNALQAIALANGLRRGPSLWNQAGPEQLASLPLAPHTAHRRSELQAWYAKFEIEIEKLNQQVENNLSRLATGVTLPRRKLYTTNGKIEFPGVSWLGITARSVDFMNDQRDLPDRTLVLRLGRLQDRKPENELLTEVERNRDSICSELLDQLNVVVRQLKQTSAPAIVQFRMADFASLARRIAAAWGCGPQAELAFRKREGVQSELISIQPPPVQDPLADMLGEWLQNPANPGRDVGAGTLFNDLTHVARNRCVPWPASSAKVLAQHLSQLQAAPAVDFRVEITYDTHAKQNLYRLWPKPDQPLSVAPAVVSDTPAGLISPDARTSPAEEAPSPEPVTAGAVFERMVWEMKKAA
jgi:hypothetical protein